MTLVAAPRASSAAPVPRPPQPIRPILISDTFAPGPEPAWTRGTWAAATAPARPRDDCSRKLRREESLGAVRLGAFMFVRTPEEDPAGGARLWASSPASTRPFSHPTYLLVRPVRSG